MVGGAVRLYVDNDVIVETTLDSNGAADIDAEPGIYTLQVMAPSAGPGCFWGTTIQDVELPRGPLELDVFYICSGDG